ncbi:hypothetical protein [Micromonospora wenchangensis]|uniref:hypothetical protein n=1 Tax=Micromonospora wenchangensis TaxID=1185415 RepID=UPI003D73AFB0
MRAGELLHLTRDASVQFIRPITVRVIRVLTDWHTYDGWVWVDAYQLNAAGDAVRRRTLFLRSAGVRRSAPRPEPVAGRQPGEADRPGPATRRRNARPDPAAVRAPAATR